MRFAGQTPRIPELLKAFVTGGAVPAQDAWALTGLPEREFLLDPVLLARQLGTPLHQSLVDNTANYESGRRHSSVDKGALAFDLLMGRAGIPTNLSSAIKPPTTYYPIAPDVNYKRQFKQAVPGKADIRKNAAGDIVEFIGLTETPMMDWDAPGPYHADRNATVRHLGDVEELINSYIQKHPASMLRLYQTPGGFRAWEIGERMPVADFQPRFEELNVDPDYALISNTGLGKSVEGVPIDPPSFRSRISHKPGRVDWVAQPIATFTGPEAMPDPRSRMLIDTLHDLPIRQHYLKANGASPDAINALRGQLPTASQGLRKLIARKLSI